MTIKNKRKNSYKYWKSRQGQWENMITWKTKQELKLMYGLNYNEHKPKYNNK
jgi:hypothetical protein